MNKQCIIKVGDTEAMGFAVKQFLESRGVQWRTRLITHCLGELLIREGRVEGHWGSLSIYSTGYPKEEYPLSDYPRFDAATEFGKLVEFFRPDPAIRVGEHTVEFTGNTIKVGCQEVHKDTVAAIYKRLFPEAK